MNLARMLLVLALLVAVIPIHAEGKAAQIHVSAAGEITLNGKRASLAQVKEELQRLKNVGGTVEYSRANPRSEPHPVAMEIMDAVADAGLPIRMPQLGGQ